MTRWAGVLCAAATGWTCANGLAVAQVNFADAIEDPAEVVRFDGHKVVRAYIRNADDLNLMQQLSQDPWSHGEGMGPVDYRIAPDNMHILDASGIAYDILIGNIQTLIDIEQDQIDVWDQNQHMLDDDAWYESYHNLSDQMTYMDDLAAAYPGLASVSTIGSSLEGRDIRALHLTGAGGPNRPTLVIESNQHAREWVTLQGTMFIAEQLLSGYGSDPDATAILDTMNVHVIVSVNPDGYVYTWGPNRMWRKNRRDNGGGSWGVDTNRNWDTCWGCEGSSGNPDSETYRGPSAFSEPETQTMRDFLANLPRVDGFIDYHSYSQLILQPWGSTSNLPADHARLDLVGGNMNDAAMGLYGKTYVHGPAYTTIYPASGTAGDYPYDEFGVNSYTIEMRDEGQFGFLLPADQIRPAAEEGFAAFKELAAYTMTQLLFTYPDGLPAVIDPDTLNTFQVQIDGVNGGTFETGSGKLFARLEGVGNYVEYGLSDLGGGLFEATLPATACDDTLEFYLEAKTTDDVTQRSPLSAPLDVYSAYAIYSDVVFEDDFQGNKGWTVQNVDLTDGAWDRGVPAGAGDRGDPLSDFDGSGACYLTDNVAGNSDVDGGPTRLMSPVIDLSSGDATISYARWFHNDDGDGDRLTVEVSNNNGSNWTLVESVGNTGGWTTNSFVVSDYVTPTASVRVRFNATDNPNDSVTEAAIDAFNVARLSCNNSDCMTLTVTNLKGGEDATFEIDGATPGATVAVAYGLQLGSFNFNGGGWCVDFGIKIPAGQANSRIVVQGAADGSGSFSKDRFIPSGFSGVSIHLQGAEKDTCPDSCMSNVVSDVIE